MDHTELLVGVGGLAVVVLGFFYASIILDDGDLALAGAGELLVTVQILCTADWEGFVQWIC